MSTVSLFGGNDTRSANVTTNFFRRDSISFQCSSVQPYGGDKSKVYIHPEIFNVFKNAIQGKAHENMVANPDFCIQGDKGHCGNRRGDLAECRCEDLNRKKNPHIRHQFENNVIEKILDHPKIEQSLSSGSPFQFNLAVFCSGRLLGEEILLFRLFNALHNKGVSGTINMFLIDRGEYGPAIALGDASKALRQHKYLNQFLTEICGCLPPSLKVNGTIFAEADHYISQVQSDGRFRHDLLIGADMEGAYKYMPKINSEASMTSGQTPLVLVGKSDGISIPSVCEVSAFGQLTNCYAPLNLSGSNSPQQAARRSTSRPPWEAPVLVGVGVVAVVAILVLLGSESTRSRGRHN